MLIPMETSWQGLGCYCPTGVQHIAVPHWGLMDLITNKQLGACWDLSCHCHIVWNGFSPPTAATACEWRPQSGPAPSPHHHAQVCTSRSCLLLCNDACQFVSQRVWMQEEKPLMLTDPRLDIQEKPKYLLITSVIDPFPGQRGRERAFCPNLSLQTELGHSICTLC